MHADILASNFEMGGVRPGNKLQSLRGERFEFEFSLCFGVLRCVSCGPGDSEIVTTGVLDFDFEGHAPKNKRRRLFDLKGVGEGG